MTINEAQDEVIEEFSDFTDWMDKYQLLIDLGNEQEPLDNKYKTESNLIDGCQSRVWLQADYVDGKIIFTAESDALIVKGIIALLITGPTTGVIYMNADEIRYDLEPVEEARKGQRVSMPVPAKVRPSDKLFKLERVEE